MGTPNPGARGDGGLRATLEAARKDREQLRRLTSNLTQPNVFSSDGQKLVIPGHTAMTDNAGKVLTVNATGDEYELAAAAGGGGGGGPVGTTRATVTGYSGGSTTYSPDTWAAADVPTYYDKPAGWSAPEIVVNNGDFMAAVAVREAGWYVARASFRMRWLTGSPTYGIAALHLPIDTLYLTLPTFAGSFGPVLKGTITSDPYYAPPYGDDNLYGDTWLQVDWAGAGTLNDEFYSTAQPQVYIDFTRLG